MSESQRYELAERIQEICGVDLLCPPQYRPRPKITAFVERVLRRLWPTARSRKRAWTEEEEELFELLLDTCEDKVDVEHFRKRLAAVLRSQPKDCKNLIVRVDTPEDM